MAMFIKGNGSMTRHEDLENILITTEQFIKVNGLMICSMEKVFKLGMIIQDIKGNLF